MNFTIQRKCPPEGVPRRDTQAERQGEVDPETLPELAGDGCNGHVVI